MPMVSVIIPTYNRADLIERAMRSAAAQTLDDIEVVVVDDCSSDQTAEVVRPWLDRDRRFSFHRLPRNVGAAGAINAMVAQCHGQFIAVLDSDDEWLPDKLEKQLRPFLADSSARVALVTCDGLIYSHSGAFLGTYRTRPDFARFPRMLARNAILSNSSVIVSRKVISEVGERDPSLRVIYDWDVWIRILAAGYEARIVPEPLFRYYITPTGLTRSTDQLRLTQEMLRLPEKHANLYARFPKEHSELLHSLALGLFLNGHSGEARRLFLRAVSTCPFKRQSVLGLLTAVVGSRTAGAIHRRLLVRRGDHLSL